MAIISKNILLVEDDPGISDMLSDFLGDEGFGVTRRTSGSAALHELQCSDFDLVLLDMGLPDMTGNDVLRQMLLATIETPVIVVSATVNRVKPDVKPLVKAIVSKPFDLNDLLRAIQESARKRSQV